MHPETELMEISVIESSIDVLAQQIVCGVPRQLTLALHVIKLAVLHVIDAVSENALKVILIELSQLEQQTEINIEDTIESAGEKGSIRTNAAALAKAMHKAGLYGSRLEVLEELAEDCK